MENEEIKTSSELLEATMQGVVGPKKNWKDKLGDGEVTFSILRKLADKTLLNMKLETDKKLSDVVGLAEDLLVKAKTRRGGAFRRVGSRSYGQARGIPDRG